MLCSICNKRPAILFYDKSQDGKHDLQGICAKCAEERGINVEETLKNQKKYIKDPSQIDSSAVADQLENVLKEITDNLNLDGLENYEENSENNDDIDGTSHMAGFAIPLGPIFSNIFGNNSQNGTENKKAKSEKEKAKNKANNSNTNKKKKYLDSFGINLTEKAKKNELDLVIGREKEIQRIIQILNRRSKNNPCLIGEPGVGKTAIAQGLAIKIAQNDVPEKLINKEVYLLDMTAVVAGTQFRGQFESRMKGIIDECNEYGNIILVIDEIHNIIGAGDSEKAMNAANILKPALSNGKLQLIGTTTLKEYRKYIEKDTALERRFQQVLVEEPSVDDTINILEGIKKYYEEYHKVKISKDIIKQTVIMSEKYIHDRFLPDKAIDILDEACSRINLDNKDLAKLELLRRNLKNIQSEKAELENDQTSSEENFQKIADLKTQECQLTEQINDLSSKLVPIELTIQDIAQVIESWTKIPVKKITEAETQKLLNLENNLHKRVIGQEEAVSSVARAIRRNRAGLQSTKRPPSFIFVGPTGVGKTELAKSLAFEMFGSEDSMIRIDMSEYMESHSTSKLIGAPPGYVGYDDAGQLTDKVKRHPYSIILLDEIEKAHPDVFNILLQILDDGKLTDSQGNVVSFSNTIIIMTSNAGSNLNTNSIGFSEQAIDKGKIEDTLKQYFRPEFLNRIDEIVVFHSLTRDQLSQIVTLMLKDTTVSLLDKNIKLIISEEAKGYVLDKGTNVKFGARPLRRAIQRYIEDELAEMILRNELKYGNTIEINLKDNNLSFDIINN